MKHKHADMIKAWADNDDDLVVLIKRINSGEWIEKGIQPSWLDRFEYFLCLPKHKEAVLHSLNDGDVDVYRLGGRYPGFANADGWNANCWYMREDCESRIKPRKETRWAAYIDGEMASGTFYSESELHECYSLIGGYQAVSFEIEVK